jgi:cobalt/nickel transport system permease protein
VTEAMRCRGFDGRFHTTTAFRTTFADIMAFVVCVAAIAALVLWDRL